MLDFEVAMGLEKIEIFSPQMNADEHRLVKHKKAFICVHLWKIIFLFVI